MNLQLIFPDVSAHFCRIVVERVCFFFVNFSRTLKFCFIDVRFKSRIDWFCTYFVHLEFVPSARLSHGALGLGFLFVAVLRCIFILYLYLTLCLFSKYCDDMNVNFDASTRCTCISDTYTEELNCV